MAGHSYWDRQAVIEKEQDPEAQLIEHLARQLNYWRMAQPALFILEVTKPLSFLASQGLLLCGPVLSAFYGEPQVTEYADFLADRTNVDRLIARLEQDLSVLDTAGEEDN